MKQRITALTAAVLLFCGCMQTTHPLQSAPAVPSPGDSTFLLVLEDEQGRLRDPDGALLGIQEVPGSLKNLVTTKTRRDGGVIITGITDETTFAYLDSLIQSLTAKSGHSLPDLTTLLKRGYASCNTALAYPEYRGGTFAGPDLPCSDVMLVGSKPLSRKPIWKQRGLLLAREKHPDQIPFEPLPANDEVEKTEALPRSVTWEQALHYVSSMPTVVRDPEVNPSQAKLWICVNKSRLTNAEKGDRSMALSTVAALIRFGNAEEANNQLIIRYTSESGFAINQLDPERLSLLKQLLIEELGKYNISMIENSSPGSQ